MSNNNEQQSVILETVYESEVKETVKKEEKPKVTRNARNTQRKSATTATVADFVTNPDAPIYAIKNLPEEYVATLFAWVSRSSKSFKEHLAEAIKEFNLLPPVGKTDDLADKAKAFHDKWTVGYGHGSVAEHAKASLGLEKVSRLFTSEIELASQFLSITEYSQRYQKPQRGDWYIIEHKDLKKPMEDAFNKLFDIFEKLIDLNLAEHIRIHKEQNGKQPTAKEKSAYEKLAFEDARYVLPLAMYSQLGISTNGRAWAEVLRNLGASTLKESVDVSIKAREELQKVLPSLLRHSSPSAYQLSKVDTLKDIKEEIAYYKSKTIDDILYRPIISSSMSYRDILMTLIKTSSMAAYTDNLKIENTSISRLSIEQLEVIVMALLKDMGAHDMPPDSFKHIMFTIELSVSEANWHQLHRHNRKADFSFGLIHPENGVTIPKIAQQSEEIYALYEEADSISSELYDTINTVLTLDGDTYKANYHAQYAALNMHHRNVYMTISLWSLHHLINLRTTEEAQWDIRNTFNKVYDMFVTRYPVFAHSLKRR